MRTDQAKKALYLKRGKTAPDPLQVFFLKVVLFYF
jgi:hypothetical protein